MSLLSLFCRKNTIRGVLTNGRGWIFLILTLNSDGGGTYLESPEILVSWSGAPSSTEKPDIEAVSLVSLILADWVCLTECRPKSEALILLFAEVR